MDIRQKLQINKHGQWNKRGLWLSLGKNINVDIGMIKVDQGETKLAFAFLLLRVLWGVVPTY